MCYDYLYGKDLLDICIEEVLKMLVVKEVFDYVFYFFFMFYCWFFFLKSWVKGLY